MAQAIARTQPEPSGLDAPLDAILAKALSKDAADRYQSAAELDGDLVRYLEGRKVGARRPRGMAWRAIAVALAVAALAILAILWLRWARPSDSGHELAAFDAGAPNAMQPALSADGKWLAFASGGDIWLKPMPDGAARRATHGGAANDEPAVSPDGQWLAYHSTRRPEGVYLQNAANGEARLLVEGGRSPRFSPDGRWIAYLNTGETGGDIQASNTRQLSIVPAQGGAPVRLARNAMAIQGAAWTADSLHVYFLAVDERFTARLWSAPLDGGPASRVPEFGDTVNLYARACGATEDRLLYSYTDFEEKAPALDAFLLKPPYRGARYFHTPAPSPLLVSGCTASVKGGILADGVNVRSGVWALPVDGESGKVRGSLTPLTAMEHGDYAVESTSDGAWLLIMIPGGKTFLPKLRHGEPKGGSRREATQRRWPIYASSELAGGPHDSRDITGCGAADRGNVGIAAGCGVAWDLSAAGRWVLTANSEAHRAIVAWDSRTSEHVPVYAHPSANLYLANFSRDGRWVVFIAEEGSGPPHMWAAPFRELQRVPMAEWVDLGEGRLSALVSRWRAGVFYASA